MTSGLVSQAGTFQYLNMTAHDQKLVLRSCTIYGTAADRRYAAVWHANPNFVKWHVHAGDTAGDYQTAFNAETQLPGLRFAGYRPAYVALSTDQIYCSVFKDDVVGPWVARHGMTATEYQAEFDAQNAKGFFPICVQGGGSGAATRYAAIFAQRDIPLAREWTVTGAPVPALAGFDQLMQNFMQANGVRAAAQLTIRKAASPSWRGLIPGPSRDTALRRPRIASCWQAAARCCSRRPCRCSTTARSSPLRRRSIRYSASPTRPIPAATRSRSNSCSIT